MLIPLILAPFDAAFLHVIVGNKTQGRVLKNFLRIRKVLSMEIEAIYQKL